MKALLFTGSVPAYAVTLVLGRLVRSAYWGPLSCVRLVDLPEPALPGPEWAVVRTRYAGICGSDLHLVELETSPTASAFTSFPFVIGHENVGRLELVGEAVGLPSGRRVVVDPLLTCEVRGIEPCPACRAGNHSRCESFTRGSLSPGMLLGSCRDAGGTWSPFFVAHSSQLFPVPDAVSDEAAVLVEPLASAMHAVARSGAAADPPTATTLVVGGGVIGLGVLACLRYLGSRSRLVALVRHDHQAELARSLGADEVVLAQTGWEDRLAEVLGAELRRPLIGRPVPVGGAGRVFECAGTGSALETALRFAAPGGQAVLVGLTAAPKGIDWSFVWRKELSVRGSFCHGVEEVDGRRRRTFELALDLLASSPFDFGSLVTHRFRLEDYRRALATLLDKRRSRAVKAVFDFGPP